MCLSVRNSFTAPYPRICLVHGYSGQPRRKSRSSFELTQVLVRADVCFLHDLFCFAVVPENPSYHPEQPLVVSAHNDFKQIGLPIRHAPDDVLITEKCFSSQIFHGHTTTE